MENVVENKIPQRIKPRKTYPVGKDARESLRRYLSNTGNIDAYRLLLSDEYRDYDWTEFIDAAGIYWHEEYAKVLGVPENKRTYTNLLAEHYALNIYPEHTQDEEYYRQMKLYIEAKRLEEQKLEKEKRNPTIEPSLDKAGGWFLWCKSDTGHTRVQRANNFDNLFVCILSNNKTEYFFDKDANRAALMAWACAYKDIKKGWLGRLSNLTLTDRYGIVVDFSHLIDTIDS